MAPPFSSVLFGFSLVFCVVSILPQHGSSVRLQDAPRNLRRHSVTYNVEGEDSIEVTPVFAGLPENSEENDYDLDTEMEFVPISRTEGNDRHPCQRVCQPGKAMTCQYTFNLEYYVTMSKACMNCPFNMTHCNSDFCVSGDGVRRTILVINKQMPGPLIEVCYGDKVEVEVKNRMLDVATTIHWHGIFQKDTPYMDGVPSVTQCLISPGQDFKYSFYADNPGTHLYHSHIAVQRGDGLYGPLIVKVPPQQDPHVKLYDFDLSEHVIQIIDWQHDFGAIKFMTHFHSTGDNKPPSILINGKGRFKEFANDNEIIFTPAERFTVKKGYRYRFRVINAGFLNCPIEMTIDNHNFTVIATDGANLEPLVAETLVSAAGERYDIILDADQEVGNYWIRFRGFLDCSVKRAFQVAILQYEGANENEDPPGNVTYGDSITDGYKVNAINKRADGENHAIVSELEALSTTETDVRLKETPDVKFYFPMDFYPVANNHYMPPFKNVQGSLDSSKTRRGYTPQINHISMAFPPFPLLVENEKSAAMQFCNASNIPLECRFKFCECPHILEIPLNSVVEAILIDEGVPFNANHPFHLHGFQFRVLGVDRLGNSTTEEEVRTLDRQGKIRRNFINPPLKDTVSVPDGGYVVIRFLADNPGYWIFHCHIDYHVEMGMALVFKVGEPKDWGPAPPGFPNCGVPFSIGNEQGEYRADYMSQEIMEDTIVKNKVSSGNMSQLCCFLLWLCLSFVYTHFKLNFYFLM